MTERPWEKVHLYVDLYDGPLYGVADCGGVPHLYEKIFDEEEDEYSDLYRVEPVDEVLFALMRECNQIWLRWRAKFDAGETGLVTHPALPPDRARYDYLQQAIGHRHKPNPERSRTIPARVRKVGKFDWEMQWDLPAS